MRKIIWTDKALKTYHDTLKYWKKKTQSSEYSKKIRIAVNQAQKDILEYPVAFPIVYETSEIEVHRHLILKNFSIYYKIYNKDIIILFFFDNRDNPNKLEF